MPKEDNLKSFDKIDPDKAREIRSKGGKARVRALKEKRTFREILEQELSKKVKNKAGDEATKKEVATIVLADKCMRGDLRAIELVMKMLGEDPTKKVEITGKGGKDLIPVKNFTKEEAAAYLASLNDEY